MSSTKLLALSVLTVAGSQACIHKATASPVADGGPARTWTFDSDESLAGWTIDNDVSVDTSTARQGNGGTLKALHNDREVTAVDSRKTGLKGFNGFAVWGDDGEGRGQTIWLADLSVTLGGPVLVPPVIEANSYDEKSLAAELANSRPVVVYTRDNAPAIPSLADLPVKEKVSQYGITWTFDKPAPVGQFLNGDWYVVGPVAIEAIDPQPLYGGEIPERELDRMDKERPQEARVRNGFMLNPPAEMKVAYDSGVRNWFDPSLIQKLPVAMKPGDSLVSTISMPKNLVLHAQLRNKI